ncbi:MAG: ABC transporter ATP-binding protein [Thermaerobacter sp.]|nr:ABC transporter ATP-binding protein [Thermaerobacter sp.]
MVAVVPNAIDAIGLSKRYGARWACRDVRLVVKRGEIFGFLGPNGAGKSTVVKILLGLIHPTAGTARLLGVSYRERAVHAKIGYLPELFRYPPWLTVTEVLRYHRTLSGRAPSGEALSRVIEQVGLRGREAVRVKSLSKGLQQRLGLAVALVGEPELVFLDEPTSAMDPLGRHEVGQLLRDLRAAGTTIFLNSHLLSDLEGLCDRVALIRQGRLLYTGRLDDALGKQASYRIGVAGMTGECLQSLAVQGIPAWVEGEQLMVASERAGLPRVHQVLTSHGVEVFEVIPERETLEDWFIQRVGPEPEQGVP